MGVHSFIQKLKMVRPLYLQLLFVTLAFGLMVVASGFFVNNMLMNYLERDAKNILTQTQFRIASEFREPETMMLHTVRELRDLILDGASIEDIVDYLEKSSIDLREKTGGFVFESYMAYFFVYDDFYFSTSEWSKPDDYNIMNCPWYRTAIEANGKIAATPIFLSMRTGDYQIAYSCLISDDAGNPLCILSMHIPLDNIMDFIKDTRITEGGYGFLTSEDYNVIAHIDGRFISESVNEIAPGIEDALMALSFDTDEISMYETRNYNNLETIIYYKRIDNGWYLGLMTPRGEYYQDFAYLLGFLGLLGIVMMVVMWYILVRIDTAKESADKRSLESEKQLEAMELTQIILDSAPIGTVIWDKDAKILNSNKTMVEYLGLSDEQELINRFSELSPEYQPNGRLSTDVGGELLTRALEKGTHRTEYEHINLKGEKLPCEVTFVRVSYRDECFAVAYIRGLQEEREAQMKLREADRLRKILLESMEVMILITDIDTDDIIYMNEKVKEVFGLDDSIIGEKCWKHLNNVHNKRCGFCPKKDPEYFNGKTFTWEYHNPVVNKEHRIIGNIIDWLDGSKVFLEQGYDITELRVAMAEKQQAIDQMRVEEEANQLKSRFLANMSHEIRTPMNAILGITEVQLQNEHLKADTEEALRLVYESGNLLLNIINDILDLSKIEAGKMEILPIEYDIPSLINDSVQLNLLRYESKPIEFKILVDENTPLNLYGGELRIKQILNNILSNAFKYTDEGEVVLKVWSEPLQDDNVKLFFRVSDTGQGMTEEQLHTLFEEYTRFNLDANREILGTGLGMNIAKRLLDLMGGEIHVVSEPDKGSVFTVWIPQKRVNSQVCGSKISEKLRDFRFQSTIMSKKSRILREYMPYGSVLVVDDVESNIYAIRGMLSPYGLQVDTASNGFEAIRKIKNGKVYDIIFMDHMMPKMDGIEATNIIRNLGYTRTIIALTANALVGQADVFMQKGFDGFVSKPIDSRELNAVLNEFVRDKTPPEIVQVARNGNWTKGMTTTKALDPELVQTFLEDAENAINVIEDIFAKVDNPNERDMESLNELDIESYEIIVHGMKSALNNINEIELSAFALKLEQAAREGNADVITSETPLFIDSLKSLIKRSETDTSNADLKRRLLN